MKYYFTQSSSTNHYIDYGSEGGAWHEDSNTSVDSTVYMDLEEASKMIHDFEKNRGYREYLELFELDTDTMCINQINPLSLKKKVVKKICTNCKFWLQDPTGNYCKFGKPNRITAVVFQPKETGANDSCENWMVKK